MKFKIIAALVFTMGAGNLAVAQTPISGVAKCAQSEQRYKIEIGDRPNHAYMIGQTRCTWIKPFKIDGSSAKEELLTGFTELLGNTAHGQSFAWGTLENGDRFQVRSEGKDTLTNGVFEGADGNWNFVGGTGKLLGIKGKGTYKVKPGADGATYEIKGEYELSNQSSPKSQGLRTSPTPK